MREHRWARPEHNFEQADYTAERKGKEMTQPLTDRSTGTPGGLIAGATLAGILFAGITLIWLTWRWPTAMTWLLFGGLSAALIIGVVSASARIVIYLRANQHRYLQAGHVTQLERARTQVAPLASSYHQHVETHPALAAPYQLALPEPTELIDVVKPQAEWMGWIDEQPHTLIGGKTKAGKTWLATALLERRIDAGYDLFIIDPHSSDWLGLPTAGGSGADERRAALKAVLNEYLRRMAIREDRKRASGHELPHDYFDPLCILIDEANALLEELAAEWKTVLKQVASGSRKVGISLIMLAQSPLVEDLGISGAMRENFSRLALDERTVQSMIDSERDRPRKAALQAAFTTVDRPAAANIGAQVWLLDRRGLSPGHASAGARMWAGWDYAGRGPSSVSAATPLHAPPRFDNDVAEPVISPGAGVAPVATVALSVAEIAQIATLLMTLPTSEVAKKLDGYNARNYQEMKQKVEVVKQLIKGESR